jgi:hypothetical protein
MRQRFRINLGGEGEILDVINQQCSWVLSTSWRTSQGGWTLGRLVNQGNPVLIAENTALPFPDDVMDEVFTNSVPIDQVTHLGPGVQSIEIQRILKSGGR